jgi:hypothetical protein
MYVLIARQDYKVHHDRFTHLSQACRIASTLYHQIQDFLPTGVSQDGIEVK